MNENKAVTKLVKAMRRALQDDHRIDVPHAALRASYLKANGENPHAFGKKAEATVGAVVVEPKKAVPRVEGMVTLQLHLACTDPMFGVYDALSLDAEGRCLIPSDFDLSRARVFELSAQVPRIKKYGLPDYAQDPSGWLETSENPIELAADFNLELEDLGDDSGDSAQLLVRLPMEDRDQLLAAVLQCKEIADEVAEHVGAHYGVRFDREPLSRQGTWLLRWLGVEEDLWGDTAEPAPPAEADRPAEKVTQLPVEAIPDGLRHIKALTFDAFVEAAVRNPLVRGAFELETLSDGRPAMLYLDKGSAGRVSQDIWLEHNPMRNSVTYVLRLVDHDAGEALAETQAELSMGQAARLLDESIEQQLGLKALGTERDRIERSRWN